MAEIMRLFILCRGLSFKLTFDGFIANPDRSSLGPYTSIFE